MNGSWNVMRFGGIGLLLGGIFTLWLLLTHPHAVLAMRAPILFVAGGALMGAMVLGGAAVSRNRIVAPPE